MADEKKFKQATPFRIFDLTDNEEQMVLRIAKRIGVADKLELLRLIEYAGIKSGTALLNYVYACLSYNVRPLDFIRSKWIWNAL